MTSSLESLLSWLVYNCNIPFLRNFDRDTRRDMSSTEFTLPTTMSRHDAITITSQNTATKFQHPSFIIKIQQTIDFLFAERTCNCNVCSSMIYMWTVNVVVLHFFSNKKRKSGCNAKCIYFIFCRHYHFGCTRKIGCIVSLFCVPTDDMMRPFCSLTLVLMENFFFELFVIHV